VHEAIGFDWSRRSFRPGDCRYYADARNGWASLVEEIRKYRDPRTLHATRVRLSYSRGCIQVKIPQLYWAFRLQSFQRSLFSYAG